MIKKSFELSDKILDAHNLILFYGKNEGLKNDKILEITSDAKKTNVYKYDENEILKDAEILFNQVLNKSLFENEKFIIINRVTDKIYPTIEKIFEKNIDDKIILNANILDKKSKLRNIFEKSKNHIVIPFYEDSREILIRIIDGYFRRKKISISQSDKNIIIDRCNNDRGILNNELNKIESFTLNRKKINFDQIAKITNLNENYTISEMIDNCLAKNKKKTINILNENNFEANDSIIILRTLLIKIKKILQIYSNYKKSNNLDQTINNFKPPIFWKDKEIIKQQVKNWDSKNLKNVLFKINEIEIQIKRNLNLSKNIITNLIIELSSVNSNNCS